MILAVNYYFFIIAFFSQVTFSIRVCMFSNFGLFLTSSDLGAIQSGLLLPALV